MKKFLPVAAFLAFAILLIPAQSKADCPSCGPYHGPDCPGGVGRICYDDIGIRFWCMGACDDCVDGGFCPPSPGHAALVAYTPLTHGSKPTGVLEARRSQDSRKRILIGTRRLPVQGAAHSL